MTFAKTVKEAQERGLVLSHDYTEKHFVFALEIATQDPKDRTFSVLSVKIAAEPRTVFEFIKLVATITDRDAHLGILALRTERSSMERLECGEQLSVIWREIAPGGNTISLEMWLADNKFNARELLEKRFPPLIP